MKPTTEILAIAAELRDLGLTSRLELQRFRRDIDRIIRIAGDLDDATRPAPPSRAQQGKIVPFPRRLRPVPAPTGGDAA
mgnify:CR=1 FL=1